MVCYRSKETMSGKQLRNTTGKPENPSECSESGTRDIDDDSAINNLEQLLNIPCEHNDVSVPN